MEQIKNALFNIGCQLDEIKALVATFDEKLTVIDEKVTKKPRAPAAPMTDERKTAQRNANRKRKLLKNNADWTEEQIQTRLDEMELKYQMRLEKKSSEEDEVPLSC